jgi:hypothetical protein
MSADNKFKSIRSMSEKQVRLLHHIENLQHYVKCNKAPAGLTIRLTPQVIGEPSKRLTNRWQNVIDTCSQKLCNLLLEHSIHQTRNVAKQISITKEQLSKSTTPDEFQSYSNRIVTCEDTVFSKLTETRKRKFRRDGIPIISARTMPFTGTTRRRNPRNRRFQRLTPAPINNVVNLSSVDLSDTETKLLSKGLNFCPKPTAVNTIAVKQDLQAFSRRLRLKDYFFDAESTDHEENIPRFRKKSKWQPPKSKDPALEAFIQALDDEVMSHRANPVSHDNLTKTEKDALASLQNRQDIVIKPADKGSAVVIMDTEKYIDEANRQLSDKRFYKQLDSDPTGHHSEQVTELLHEMADQGHIDGKTMEYLLPEVPKAGRLYLLPKLHKPGHPGRPIISANGHPTEKISEFLDFHLRPLVQQIPSYIQDTTDFVRKINSLDIPSGSILATLDVTSLYTNIPHEEGIEACREAWDSRTDQSMPTKYLVKLLRLVLTLNNFEFNGHHYIQINGTAMGTKMAPSYANIFMGRLEKDMLSSTPSSPKAWFRFIDDIFSWWDDSEEHFTAFLDHCNSFHTTIKFTAEHSKEHVTFLDTTTSIQNGNITTDLYTKPTDTHQYLLPSSCHPPHCAKNIPFSLAVRLRRICSNVDTFSSRSLELKQQLFNRKYNYKHLENSIQAAKNLSRDNVLEYKTKTQNTRTPLVITYHPDLPNISEITRRLWHTVLTSKRMRALFPEPPLISYRRPRNLRDHLVRAKLQDQKESVDATICQPCGDKRCFSCPMINHTATFKSSVTKRSFKLFCNTNCKSANAIYLIECEVCQIQYVGETKNPVHKRINQHRTSTKDPSTSFPVGIHFGQSNSPTTHRLENMKFTVIDCNPNWTDKKRKDREAFWIQQLHCLQPDGLNLESGINT